MSIWNKPINSDYLDKSLCYYSKDHRDQTEGIIYYDDDDERWRGFWSDWVSKDHIDWDTMSRPYLSGPAWSELPCQPCAGCDAPIYGNDYLCQECRP